MTKLRSYSHLENTKLTRCDHRHKSIIAYLSANNLPNATAALRAELNLSEDTFDPATAKKYETLLEKKWTSIVRLQKKARLPLPCLGCCGGQRRSRTPRALELRSNSLVVSRSWIWNPEMRHCKRSLIM